MAEKKSKSANGTPRTTPNKPAVPAMEFVKTWQASASLDEAKAKLGEGASSRAARMRKEGVKLKEMPGGGRKLDVAALNAIIDEAR